MTSEKTNDWIEIFETWLKGCPQKLWRIHSDAVNTSLLSRWLSIDQIEYLLKTDLFDETINEGLYPVLASRGKYIIGMDLYFSITHKARLRYPHLQTIEADVRRLPFSNDTFDSIVSNSTLDHFESPNDLVTSLQELYRVLRPGGQMILTLDNLANPIIFLRNELPFALLHRLGIVPYYIGVTIGPSHLKKLLGEIGFHVDTIEAIMHCPRVLAVSISQWIERHTSMKTQRDFLRLLTVFESLSLWPTRFWTGHFVAVKATKT